MNISEVAAEMATKLDTIAGLRVTAYRPGSISPPAAFPDLPERINYDSTYGRGLDHITIPVNVLVGKVSDRASHQAIGAYVDGSGAKSFKATLDSSGTNTYTSCDSVTVVSVEFAVFSFSAVDYLAASFNVDVHGSGS